MKSTEVQASVTRYLPWIILILAGLGVFVGLAKLLPPAFDLHTYFYPGVRDWLDGGLVDADWPNWLYTPWVLIYFAPFALLPEAYARSAFAVFAILAILWTTRNIAKRRLGQALIMVSFPVLGVFWEGALEPYSILGIGLCALAVRDRRPWLFSIGFPLLFAKPQETLLVGALLIWSIRKWNGDELLKASVGPLAVFAIGLLLFDLTWISKLLQGTGQHHGNWVNISVWWRLASYWASLAISIIIATVGVYLSARLPFSQYSLALIVAFGSIASPYLATHHLALAMALSWPWLLRRRIWVAGFVYLSSLTPLLRLGGDQSMTWIDSLFPIVLVCMLLYYYPNVSDRMRIPTSREFEAPIEGPGSA